MRLNEIDEFFVCNSLQGEDVERCCAHGEVMEHVAGVEAEARPLFCCGSDLSEIPWLGEVGPRMCRCECILLARRRDEVLVLLVLAYAKTGMQKRSPY